MGLKRQKRKWKFLRMPKTYDDYKRDLRENREEIALSGSNKTYWRNLEKLIGKEKASLRREMAIAQRGKPTCATEQDVVVESDNKKKEPRES